MTATTGNLLDRIAALETENKSIRAVNAKLVEACEATLRFLLIAPNTSTERIDNCLMEITGKLSDSLAAAKEADGG